MDNDKPQKINIGFAGGPVLSARVAPSEVEKLRQALGNPDAWYQLTAEDGVIDLNTGKVVYLLVDIEAHRVGFGG
jgi:hypothetical protein